MSVIVGLDISLNSPGWCKIDTDTSVRTFDTMDFSRLRGLGRIGAAARALVEIVRPADLVVMEGLSMGMPSRNGMAFVPQGRYDLVGLTYLVRMWLYTHQRRTLLVPPSTLKKFATGKGNCQKSLILREVFQRWGVEAMDDNAADAVALAEFGRAWLNPDAVEAKFQRECLKKASLLDA